MKWATSAREMRETDDFGAVLLHALHGAHDVFGALGKKRDVLE